MSYLSSMGISRGFFFQFRFHKSYSWFLDMMTSSNGNIFRVTGYLCGEFTGPSEFPAQRTVTRSLDVFFDLHPNKWLSKQWWGWWFETQSCPLWRHRNEFWIFVIQLYQLTMLTGNSHKTILTTTRSHVEPTLILKYTSINCCSWNGE